MTYYIDAVNGSPAVPGTDPRAPRATYTDLSLQPGDTVLFRRGTVMRAPLERVSGAPGAPITYGAFGEGPAPVFSGSVPMTEAGDWREIRRNVWEYRPFFPDETCNFIFAKHGEGMRGGALRWSAEELRETGDWYDSRAGSRVSNISLAEDTGARVLLYFEGNPVENTDMLELVPYGGRKLSRNVSYTAVEDLAFWGSGVHALAGGARHTAVRRCAFGFIGGAVWSKALKIRFGNAIEFWDFGEDILVEDCYFNNIYDSCITHQGGADCTPAQDLVMRGNLFLNYGMAAYEGRDRVSVRSSFTDNLCFAAGGGFTGLGDLVPRRSEIYPRPMGHHVFLWRQEQATENGAFLMENNVFGEATGAAVYSVSSAAADSQQTQKNNRYAMTPEALCCRKSGTDYSAAEWLAGKEEGAVWETRSADALIAAWFARTGVDSLNIPLQ